MDSQKRQELLDQLMEVKDLIDEAFPLGSSVVTDQILGSLFMSMVHEVLWEPPRDEEHPRPRRIPKEMKMVMGMQFRSHIEGIAATLTEVAASKGTEWTSDTYRHFIEMLMQQQK